MILVGFKLRFGKVKILTKAMSIKYSDMSIQQNQALIYKLDASLPVDLGYNPLAQIDHHSTILEIMDLKSVLENKLLDHTV